jgi:hypothetical protein
MPFSSIFSAIAKISSAVKRIPMEFAPFSDCPRLVRKAPPNPCLHTLQAKRTLVAVNIITIKIISATGKGLIY